MLKPVITVTALVESINVVSGAKKIGVIQPDADTVMIALENRSLNEVVSRLNATHLVRAELDEGINGSLEAKYIVSTGKIYLKRNKSYSFQADVSSVTLPPDPKTVITVIDPDDDDMMGMPYLKPSSAV